VSAAGPSIEMPGTGWTGGTPPAGGPTIAGLPNLRDVGGHRTRDGGRVRTGLVYRSTDLGTLDAAAVAALGRLGIRTVFDLRTAAERARQPDRLPPGSAYVVADVVGDSRAMTPAAIATLFDDPAAASLALGSGRAATYFLEAYREFVHLESARAGYRRLFVELAGGASTPALVHCTTGKDRTGWAAAALLLFLGVPEESVMEEYLLSGPQLVPVVQPLLDAFAARGGDPELLRPLLGVEAAYLEASLGEVRRQHGSIEGYVRDGLGVDAQAQAALRALLVEPA
jgi:protein-tyrosine phosphatase